MLYEVITNMAKLSIPCALAWTTAMAFAGAVVSTQVPGVPPDLPYGVAVSGKYAYVVTSVLGNDFHIIDISDPTTPVLKGELNLPDTANKVVVEGGYAYVTTDSAGDDVHVINSYNFV